MEPTKLDWKEYTPADGLFKDQVVLVTGAAGGIGRAVTLALAARGATVIMLDRKLRHLEKIYDEIVATGHTEPVLLPVELARLDHEAAVNIASGIEQDFGRLDALLHNAADLGSPGPLAQYPTSAWSAVMQVNLQAPWVLTQALLPVMEAADSASVLFSSARCGRVPAANWGAYSIAYAAVEAQMKIWAEEMKNISSIRFNSVDPGAVNTPMRRVSHPGESPSATPVPEDVVLAYLFLLGHDSADIVGESLEL